MDSVLALAFLVSVCVITICPILFYYPIYLSPVVVLVVKPRKRKDSSTLRHKLKPKLKIPPTLLYPYHRPPGPHALTRARSCVKPNLRSRLRRRLPHPYHPAKGRCYSYSCVFFSASFILAPNVSVVVVVVVVIIASPTLLLLFIGRPRHLRCHLRSRPRRTRRRRWNPPDLRLSAAHYLLLVIGPTHPSLAPTSRIRTAAATPAYPHPRSFFSFPCY